VVEIGMFAFGAVLLFRACLFAVTEIGIVGWIVLAFVLAIVKVVENARVAAITLDFILFWTRLTVIGIVTATCLKEYFIRSRVTEIGILAVRAREISFWINGTMSRIRAIDGNPNHGILDHLTKDLMCKSKLRRVDRR
jgi:hypothetical protein